MTDEPAVDVVIAVHDPSRRVDRALRSLVDPGGRVRVTVVCHGLDADAVSPQIREGKHPSVRVVEYTDGVRSPSGPFNHGLGLATGRYVMIMGSDDFLEPGAIGAWLDAADAAGADIQIAPLRYQNGARLLNPLTRPWRRHRLDPVRDRLFHRTAPLALIRRELVQAGGEGPLSAGMPVGGDLAWSSRLWTSPARIDFDPRHPAYVIGDDAAVRVTTQPRAIDDVMNPVDALLASHWAVRQPARVRASLTAKLLRVNIIGAIRSRPRPEDWSEGGPSRLAQTIASIRRYGDAGFSDLPRADRDLLDAAARADADATHLVAAAQVYKNAGRFDRLVPRRVTRVLGRESVLRRYVRYAMERRLGA
jgi:hypothetical protein